MISAAPRIASLDAAIEQQIHLWVEARAGQSSNEIQRTYARAGGDA